MPASPRELPFAALFAYSPNDSGETARRSKKLLIALKTHGFTRPRPGDSNVEPQIISDWIADRIVTRLHELPFANFFNPDVTLIPMPTHAKRQEGALWVPMQLCEALCRERLAAAVLPCVVRTSPVAKAATSRPDERLGVEQHLQSIAIERALEQPMDVLLVDDVVTRGATFMAAAIRVGEAFPSTRVRAFAAIRTMSDPETFRSIEDPCAGIIKLYESGKTHREP